MRPHFTLRLAATSVALALSFVSFSSLVHADSGGRTGKAQAPTGCNCHGASNTSGVVVTITGPRDVAPSSTNSYTLTVTGGPAGTKGGFDLKASSGALVAGTGSRVSGTDITNSDANRRSWTFQWTAPAAGGTQNFWAVGVAADGDGSSDGDAWNWYGGILNTAFAITIEDQVGVVGLPGMTWLAPMAPNPLAGSGRVSFSLATAGSAQLDAYDASGRRVALLARGQYPAGTQTVSWNGRDDGGRALPNGAYFLKLHTSGRELTTRAFVRH